MAQNATVSWCSKGGGGGVGRNHENFSKPTKRTPGTSQFATTPKEERRQITPIKKVLGAEYWGKGNLSVESQDQLTSTRLVPEKVSKGGDSKKRLTIKGPPTGRSIMLSATQTNSPR